MRTRLQQPRTIVARQPVQISQARRARCPECPDLLIVVTRGRTASDVLTEHYTLVHF